MPRYIASILFKDTHGTTIPYLLRYNSGDLWDTDAFELVKDYICKQDDVTYLAGKPYACYSDNKYSNIYPNIDKDYSFLFQSQPKQVSTNHDNQSNARRKA